MRVTIHAVGRLKRGPESDLCDRYLDRFSKTGPSLGLDFAGLVETPESRARDAQGRRREEAGKVRSMLDSGAALILLDETGNNFDSQALAAEIGGLRDIGVRDCLFAIGGPDGHDPSLRADARLVVSFGKLTWPHQLARIMLAEQLYRSASILAGHPYHRA